MMTRHVFLLVTLAFTGLGAYDSTQVATAQTIGTGAPTVVRTANATGNAGLVASAHRRATEAGLEMLESGGNAFDAAVAVAATLTVVEPMNSNIFGGYGTIILYDAEQKELRYLDNNARFPQATNSDVFRQTTNQDVMRTALAVSTPGNLHGFEAMWQAYGNLPWATLWEPAAFHADEGVAVTAPLARAIATTWGLGNERAKDN